MDIDSFMWISVDRFHELMGWPIDAIKNACEVGGIISKYILGECRICIKSLSIYALNKHLSEELPKVLEDSKELVNVKNHLNALAYLGMRPCERKGVDKWLPIIIGAEGLKGGALKEYLNERNISYVTFLRHRNKWKESGGNVNSLRVNYGRTRKLRRKRRAKAK